MGAKFNIQLIGNRKCDHYFWIKLLESISTITEMIIGKLNIASIQDLKTGEIKDYSYKYLKDIVYSLDNKEALIFLYSEDFKKGSLSLRYEGNHWVLCISFNAIKFSNEHIEDLMLNIWRLVDYESLLFITAGEELELTHQDILSVINNENFVLNIPLCEFAIIDGSITRKTEP